VKRSELAQRHARELVGQNSHAQARTQHAGLRIGELKAKLVLLAQQIEQVQPAASARRK
jgi:hypothetical protein